MSYCFIHDMILWEENGVDDDGELKVLAPVAIRARFQKDKRAFLDPNTNKEEFLSVAAVDRDIKRYSLLWFAPQTGDIATTLADLIANSIVPNVQDIYQVTRFRSASSISGTVTRRLVELSRFKQINPQDIIG